MFYDTKKSKYYLFTVPKKELETLFLEDASGKKMLQTEPVKSYFFDNKTEVIGEKLYKVYENEKDLNKRLFELCADNQEDRLITAIVRSKKPPKCMKEEEQKAEKIKLNDHDEGTVQSVSYFWVINDIAARNPKKMKLKKDVLSVEWRQDKKSQIDLKKQIYENACSFKRVASSSIVLLEKKNADICELSQSKAYSMKWEWLP